MENTDQKQTNQNLKEEAATFFERLSKRRNRYKKLKITKAETLRYDISPPVPVDYKILKKILLLQMSITLHKQRRRFSMLPQNGLIVRQILQDVISTDKLAKGSFVFGPHSSGKSFFFNHLAKALTNLHSSGKYLGTVSIKLYQYQSLALQCNTKGNLSPVSNVKPPITCPGIIMLDDLGYLNESRLTLFGNKVNLVSKIVQRLYQLYHKGYVIYINSNIDPDTLLAEYGKGTYDRVGEMCGFMFWEIDGDGYRH